LIPLSIWLPSHVYFCLSVFPSVQLSVYLWNRLPVYPSLHLSAYPSTCLLILVNKPSYINNFTKSF
jgi:hypothetical protein